MTEIIVVYSQEQLLEIATWRPYLFQEVLRIYLTISCGNDVACNNVKSDLVWGMVPFTQVSSPI